MKNFGCPKCGSTNVYMKPNGTATALMCKDCNRWIKWVGKNEIPLVEKFIEENKKPIALESLCKPISDYIKENYNPMTAIVITDSQVRIIEDIEGFPI